MKRPNGFTTPVTPAEPQAGPGTGARGRTGRGAVAAGKPGRRGRNAAGIPEAEATTEPIPIQAPASTFRAATPSGVPARSDREAATPPLTPAQARKQFRAARRARKHYERDEVRRFTWRSRRRRKMWLVSIGAALALVAFVLIGAYSPLMELRTIEVVGTNRIPADQIQAALAKQLGTPLPLVDSGQIKSDLAEFNLIRSYVTESRPPHTLVVRVIEREPVGVIPSSTGFDLVDAAGVVIQRDTERPPGYPVIQARAGVGSAGFQSAAAVVMAVPDGIRSQLDTVTAATKDDVTLILAGGARVVWGSPEKSEYKAIVLQALMVSSPVGTVGEYDVSSPDSAVLR
ncbi:MAG TPA: FtsQ-type POTRA domain-containing protein [Glaciibacter sp.]|nr:FtsQ-type POTRA domain-containing protein [Glaciibacter sp.]